MNVLYFPNDRPIKCKPREPPLFSETMSMMCVSETVRYSWFIMKSPYIVFCCCCFVVFFFCCFYYYYYVYIYIYIYIYIYSVVFFFFLFVFFFCFFVVFFCNTGEHNFKIFSCERAMISRKSIIHRSQTPHYIEWKIMTKQETHSILTYSWQNGLNVIRFEILQTRMRSH